MARHQPDPFVVPLSKAKISLILLGSVGFVALSLWLWANADRWWYRNPWTMKATAAVAIVFFGLIALSTLRKLFDTSPGLVIDAEGIIDNSSGVSAGRIPWSDIRGLDVMAVQSRKFLAVRVKNPEKYIRRASFLKRRIVQLNANSFGSPIYLSTTTLKIKFDELVKIATESFEKYRQA